MTFHWMKTKFQDVIDLILENLELPVIITSHTQADLDSLSSAILTKYLIDRLTNFSSNAHIILPKVSKLTQKAIELYNLKLYLSSIDDIENIQVEECIIILVDTNQPSITNLKEIFNLDNNFTIWNSSKKRIIIDHHIMEDTKLLTDVKIINNSYCSTTEILIDFVLDISDLEIDKKILIISLLGILFDSKRLSLVNGKTLKKVSFILDQIGGILQDYMDIFDNEKEYSERIALIKSAQRNKLVKINNQFLLSLSQISSYESGAARSLISLGSDISAVFNFSDDHLRISFRSSTKFYNKTKIHCGKLAQQLGEKFGGSGGSGGGHPTAAGCNIHNHDKKKNLKSIIYDFIIKYLEENTLN